MGSILAINGGSSSVKFAIFDTETLERRLGGRIERVGTREAALVAGGEKRTLDASNHEAAVRALFDWLSARSALRDIAAVGHRVVHGGVELNSHARVTPELLGKLDDARPFDPAHLPFEIAMIRAASRALAGVPQVACFDTAFFRDLPRVAQSLPIPRTYLDGGIRRLGFHGLSYAYLIEALRHAAGDFAADGRVLLAHLGSGASLAALSGGSPVDTTMAFTPAAGLVMATRPGDLDPGLVVYLMRAETLSPDAMDAFVNERCGLKGVSGTTGDMRELLARRAEDPRAAEAVALFVYQATKGIGAFAAALGGLDTLVFSGGIGEGSAVVREEICARLGFLGLSLDRSSNEAGAAVISDSGSRMSVRVIPTDEEIVMARIVRDILRKER